MKNLHTTRPTFTHRWIMPAAIAFAVCFWASVAALIVHYLVK